MYSPPAPRSSWNWYGSTSYSLPSSTRFRMSSVRARAGYAGSRGIRLHIVSNILPRHRVAALPRQVGHGQSACRRPDGGQHLEGSGQCVDLVVLATKRKITQFLDEGV